MADKWGFGNEARELKIGQSFTNPRSTAFHSIRYDFKPASVDTSKKATVEVGSNNQVTVTVPNLDGGGVETVFKGSQRPYQKECVLIIDRATGTIVLEKLSSNMQVKKTRSESAKMPVPQEKVANRSQTPPIGQRISHRTKVTSGSRRSDRPITQLVPKHSPLHASPNYPSPGHATKSPKNESGPQSSLASLPIIGMDEFATPPPAPEESSDSSSSSSDSDSDSEDMDNVSIEGAPKTNGHIEVSTATKMSSLNEDLCLSESESD